jgi:OOP family OmpA-OmpF porin
VILAEERVRIARLEERPSVSAESLARCLPEAISSASGDRLQALSIALEPALTAGVRTVARKEAELFGDVLSPTIASAVRKAVADAMKAIMERVNEALDQHLSIRSLEWRVEAWRTRRPFAEVFLARTLIYRVEQVFLIHTETGLLLQHVASLGVELSSVDQIAAMLSAIDTFAREAFRPLPPGVHLRQFELGELAVWIERDPTATLVAVVRGAAPTALEAVLQEARTRIDLGYRAELDAFVSDPSPFEATRPILEACLRLERRKPPRRAPVLLGALLGLLLAVLGFAVAHHLQVEAAAGRRRAAYVQAFRAEPGIVVTAIDHPKDGWRLEGLRDPLARPPAEVLDEAGLPSAELAFVPFYSLEPRIIERRAAHMLAPPAGVKLEFDRGTLRASGVAPRAWIARSAETATQVPGVERWEGPDLLPSEAVQELESARVELEQLSIPFELGQAGIGLPARSVVAQAVRLVRRAIASSHEIGGGVCFEIVGHSDPSGGAPLNLALENARAEAVEKALLAAGVDPSFIEPRSAGQASERHPEVGFRVRLEKAPGPSSCGGSSP